MRVLLFALLAFTITCMTAWGVAFIWFSNLSAAPLRAALAVLFGVGTVASFLFLKKRRRTLAVYLGVFALLVGWFFSIAPSNDREWAPEVAVLPTVVVNGHVVEIKNVRNFDYRTDTDF